MACFFTLTPCCPNAENTESPSGPPDVEALPKMSKIAVGLLTGYLILGCTSPETASSTSESGTPAVPISEVGQVVTAEEMAALIEEVGIAEDSPPAPTRNSAELEALHREIAEAIFKSLEATVKAERADRAVFEVAMAKVNPDFRAALKKVMRIKDREAHKVALAALFEAVLGSPEAIIENGDFFHDLTFSQEEVISRMKEERVASHELIRILMRYGIRLERELQITGGLSSMEGK